LSASRLITIEIAHETNTKRDIVHVIAVHVTTVNLPSPAIADFDLTITRGCSIANHEMIGEAIPHPPNLAMIIIKRARVSLACPAIVHDHKLPAPALNRCIANRFDRRSG